MNKLKIFVLMIAILAFTACQEAEDALSLEALAAGLGLSLPSETDTSTETTAGRAVPSGSALRIVTDLPSNECATEESGSTASGCMTAPRSNRRKGEDEDGLPTEDEYEFFVPECVDRIYARPEDSNFYIPAVGTESCFKVFSVFLIENETNEAAFMRNFFFHLQEATNIYLNQEVEDGLRETAALAVDETIDLTETLIAQMESAGPSGGGPPANGKPRMAGDPPGEAPPAPVPSAAAVKRLETDVYRYTREVSFSHDRMTPEGESVTITFDEGLNGTSKMNDDLESYRFERNSTVNNSNNSANFASKSDYLVEIHFGPPPADETASGFSRADDDTTTTTAREAHDRVTHIKREFWEAWVLPGDGSTQKHKFENIVSIREVFLPADQGTEFNTDDALTDSEGGGVDQEGSLRAFSRNRFMIETVAAHWRPDGTGCAQFKQARDAAPEDGTAPVGQPPANECWDGDGLVTEFGPGLDALFDQTDATDFHGDGPGDVDFTPSCEKEKAFFEERHPGESICTDPHFSEHYEEVCPTEYAAECGASDS